jgi:glycosyltransferase involved in cell wall biosynthesis
VADRVELTGPYTQEEALVLLHRAHILLHTKYNDPCPGIVIEALACGLPVVYSASGGVPELVGDEAGVGVPVESTFDRMIPPDPEALANGVERVRASLARCSRAARDRAVERFDIEPWLARHAMVFERGRR